jgi:stage II sporulation protein GA (sporulation sigma-E factor processing peptidase)
MVVNLDVLILQNSIVNYFLLYITSQSVRIKFNFKRAMLSSIFGGVYVITLIVPKLKLLTTLPFKFAVVIIMILLLFGVKDTMLILKSSLIYILYSMLLAGLCFFIEYNQDPFANINSFDFGFSYKKLMLAIMVIYMLINRLVVYIKDRKDICSLIYTVEIKSRDTLKTVAAFLDTGNELREPATNLPVLILEKSLSCEFTISDKEKLFIPYKVVNGQAGRLVGFKPEYIKIIDGSETKIREVIIAFCDNKLSDLNEYQALLSRGII